MRPFGAALVLVYFVICQRGHSRTVASTNTSLPAVKGSCVCAKCGSQGKSGTFSCCSRGGAWFKKCGDAGNTAFGHTWAEGIQACKVVVTSAPCESPLEVMFHGVRVFVYPHKTVQSQDFTQLQSMSTGNHAGVVTVAFCICVLFTISQV